MGIDKLLPSLGIVRTRCIKLALGLFFDDLFDNDLLFRLLLFLLGRLARLRFRLCRRVPDYDVESIFKFSLASDVIDLSFSLRVLLSLLRENESGVKSGCKGGWMRFFVDGIITFAALVAADT